MDIQFLERTDNQAEIKITLTESDYSDKVNEEVKKLKKQASVKGFRKGHVPEGMIRKMYGESIEADVLQNLVSEKLYDTLQEEKLSTLGQPILKESDRKEDKSFEAIFRVALRPEITNKLSKEDTVKIYTPKVEDEDVTSLLQETLEQNEQVVEVDTVVSRAMLYGTIAELEGDVPKEDGIVGEDVILFPEFMKDEEEKKKFDSVAKDDIVVFQPYKAFAGDKAELKSLLKLDSTDSIEELDGIDFSFQINKIRAPRKAELNQDFYDRAFGAGKVSNEDEAKEEIRKFLVSSSENESTFKFTQDLSDYITEHKLDQINLAEDLLRDWIENGNTGVELGANGADPDEHFANIIKSLKHDLYYHAMAEELGVQVNKEDIVEYAKAFTRQQFAQFGWTNAPEEVVEKQAERVLTEDENFAYTAEKQILLQKVAQGVKERELITLDKQEIPAKELREMLSGKNEAADDAEKEDAATDK